MNIAKDKMLHMLAGASIATVSWLVLSLTHVPFAAALAIITGLVVGIARELWNKAHGGLFDIEDIKATFAGTAIIPTYKLGYSIVLSYDIVWSYNEKLFVLASAAVFLVAVFHQAVKNNK